MNVAMSGSVIGETKSANLSQVVRESAGSGESLHVSLARDLQRVDQVISDALRTDDPTTQEILTFVRSLSGKKMRPTLTILSAMSTGVVTEETIRLAAVVELVHLATLIHDDVLDHASLRRHLPTVHCQWSVPAAILTGDWLFTKAYQLANMGSSTLPGRWISGSACRLCEGENQQNQSAGKWDLSLEAYLQSLRGKTGELCSVACQLGAWSAGASEEWIASLSAYGMKLGVAFQLHDDYLDYWGMETTTGKAPFADLKSKKSTLPIIQLLAVASLEDRESILEELDLPEFTDRAAKIAYRLERHRIQHSVRSYVAEYAKLASALLNSLPETASKDVLIQLATIAVTRQA